jgi:hypothetical protein
MAGRDKPVWVKHLDPPGPWVRYPTKYAAFEEIGVSSGYKSQRNRAREALKTGEVFRASYGKPYLLSYAAPDIEEPPETPEQVRVPGELLMPVLETHGLGIYR